MAAWSQLKSNTESGLVSIELTNFQGLECTVFHTPLGTGFCDASKSLEISSFPFTSARVKGLIGLGLVGPA